MKKALLSFLFLFSVLIIQAQDTTVVQTLRWEDDFRAGTFTFPDESPDNWAKIIMLYNMRCHDLAVGNGAVGCREWDYSCNTFITDSSRMDSTRIIHPTHIISNFDNVVGDTFNFSNSPVYSYFQYDQREVTYTNVNSETTAKVGADEVPIPMSLAKTVSRQQFLYTADELSAAGFAAGKITGLKLDVAIPGEMNNFFRIRMKSTDKERVFETDPDLEDFTEVYFRNTDFSSTGEQFFRFYESFDWDGMSNVLIEFSFTNNGSTTQPFIQGHQTTDLKTLLYSGSANDYVLQIDGAGGVRLPNEVYGSISNEITISVWAKGNAAVLPVNTYIFEGVDDNDDRQVNVHLPWSNGQIYWDCGGTGGNFDRINKSAAAAEFEGSWAYWTFTKNATTGSMKIYRNGELWHSGTNKMNSIDIKKFVLGSNKNGGGNYIGQVDGLEIWDKELDAATIREWMFLTPKPAHPDFNNLIAYLPFGEGSGRITTGTSANPLSGNFEGVPSWIRLRGKDLFKSFSTLTLRPTLTFVSGDYDVEDTVITVRDSVQNSPNMVVRYFADGTDLAVQDTLFVWNTETSFVLDENGDPLDTIQLMADDAFNIGQFGYYTYQPSKFEILSLVTPYGNGLNLGPEGKTFTIDVTDYAPILRGEKRMSLEMGGQNQEEMDIKFLFIEGTPPRTVKSIQNIWPFRRGNFQQVIDDVFFEPREVALRSDGEIFKLRTAVTGHGQNGEFQSRNHFLNINGGTKEFNFDVWKECGDMPIYPQGGTWLFDRAGWCPGVPTDVHEYDITSMVNAGGSVEVDYGVNGGFMSDANYLVSSQLVTYSAPNFTTEAEILEVIRPTTQLEHARQNPACNEPAIRIKNNGSEPLTSLMIEYGERDGAKNTYEWTGNLAFLETTDISLPLNEFDFWTVSDDPGVFEVTISNPNGGMDENPNNNFYSTPFERPKELETGIELEVKTNNNGFETSYRIKDMDGNVLLDRNGLANNTTYTDVIDFGPGCYTFEIFDSEDDGLYYWFWEQAGPPIVPRGRGSIRMVKLFNTIKLPVQQFEEEFGRFIRFDFTIPQSVSTVEKGEVELFSVYPNPSFDEINLDLRGFENEDFTIEVVDLNGRILLQKQISIYDSQHVETINIQELPSGVYFTKVKNADKSWVKEIIKR